MKRILIPLNQPLDPALNLRPPNGQSFSVTSAQFNSLQKLPQVQKDEILLASLRAGDCLELPTFIVVETRFITKQSLEFNQFGPDVQVLELSSSVRQKDAASEIQLPSSVSQKDAASEIKTTPKQLPTFANATIQADVMQEDRGTVTENPNPVRDRCSQTDHRRLKTVAVQCCIEEELDLRDDAESDCMEVPEVDTDPLVFSAFICENALLYSNDKVECRICGEVVKNFNDMEMHLAVHFGPKVLCFLCGLLFENKALLRHHICDGKKNKPARLLHCPHYRCNVRAISKLELYDHINEHCSEDCYKCKSCGRTYPTSTELQQHTKLQKKCRGAKLILPYRKPRLQGSRNLASRMRVQTIYQSNGTKALRVLRLDKCKIPKMKKQCPICLQIYNNRFKYRRHRQRCLVQHIYRLKTKQEEYYL